MADQDANTPFRGLTRERLLKDMLRSAKVPGTSEWKVLVIDEVTTKVMSTSCKMADITDEGISLVEDLNKRRQPLPALDAVYFIHPSRESVRKFIQDMGGKNALYRRAHVFFSSPLPKDLLQSIKNEPTVLPRIAALKEMNLEYQTVDQQSFITDNPRSLDQLYGEDSDGSAELGGVIDVIAMRLATVFASLKEFPVVRYKSAAKAAASNQTSARDLVPTKVAAALWDRLNTYKNSLPNFPQTETCQLLIVDRTVDTIAPVIHEWTYDAMCHDLLDLDGVKYKYEVTTSSGKKEMKEVLLDEHDPIWVELRDLHIAEANLKLNDKMQHFGQKNKAAQIRLGGRQEEISTRDMHKMVQALPQYREQLDKLGLHIHIATVLNEKIQQEGLTQIGTVEQDMVYGDASSKELINLFGSKPNMSPEDKVRLLAIYAATHPEKLDATKRMQWQKLARLSGEDMNAINNLEFLGVAVSKRQSNTGFTLKFGLRKPKRALRKDKMGDEEQWSLSRFSPLIQDVVEDMAKGDLSKDDYPFLKEPSPTTQRYLAGAEKSPVSAAPSTTRPSSGMPIRSHRTTNWAQSKARSSDGAAFEDGPSTRPTSADNTPRGSRIFVFMIGGMTRSEIRSMHKLTASLKREIVIGSTNIDNPHTFLAKLRILSSLDDIDL
eukprot:TRINITY_DN18717_c0_g1_i1.p1 TRINITY_DN18717_c0_g1~~TRINITY_DN18717_c0_g1_i1.p1  ORF type:complete len:662 (+),score=131.15 TRINITY_DN18717_c0_g1_i1:190-2175(+)